MTRGGLWRGVLALGLYAFIYLPIVVVVIYSFNAARYGTLWEGATWRWYRELFVDHYVRSAAGNTLFLAVCSTMIATVLGTVLGLGLQQWRLPGRRWVGLVLYVPVILPEVVMGVSLMLFYVLIRQWVGWFELGMTTLIIAHVTFQLPFVAMVVRARAAGADPALEEAARDLGADRWRTFWHVTFPTVLPGVVAGALLAFTLSLDDFVVSFFTTGPAATTLPIFIYSSVKRGITPEINALASLMILVSVTAVIAAVILQRKRELP